MFPLPLVVTIQPSRRFRAVLWTLHGVAALAIGYAAMPLTAQLGAWALLLVSLVFTGHPQPPLTLRCKGDGGLEIRQGDDWQAVKLDLSSVALPGLTVLRIRPPNSRWLRSWVILGDSLPAEDFRRLRVWLRWLGGQKLMSADVGRGVHKK